MALYGVGRAWDPWQELDRLRRQMDDAFLGGASRPRRTRIEFPPVNLWQSEHGLLLTAEIPGVNPDDLEITVTNKAVTIEGRRQDDGEQEGRAVHRKERLTEPFSKTVELPFEIDTERADASCQRGVLTLTMQRPQEQTPKKVTIKGG